MRNFLSRVRDWGAEHSSLVFVLATIITWLVMVVVTLYVGMVKALLLISFVLMPLLVVFSCVVGWNGASKKATDKLAA